MLQQRKSAEYETKQTPQLSRSLMEDNRRSALLLRNSFGINNKLLYRILLPPQHCLLVWLATHRSGERRYAANKAADFERQSYAKYIEYEYL
mmetsp:Transcript_1716/g.2189  ORF Transcript_1716/g.2189 Transcript_1716/m.2189 type:complete len:92 (+) Transcript_1716:63-338(+)